VSPEARQELPHQELTQSAQTAKDDTVVALTAHDLAEATDPFALFSSWLAAADKSEINDPTAMSLATVDPDGLPDVRMVLLKAASPEGFVFYSNRESAKGVELDLNMKAAALFHWKSLRRQIRIRGLVELVSDAEADDYFRSRPLQSRIGAWASQQSRPLESRFALETAVAKYAAKFALGTVPRPAYWIGYRIRPLAIEFWSDGAFRLHNRIVFRRQDLNAVWTKERLYP
jgi:pyridoxamine 5'-phosphate oxidase